MNRGATRTQVETLHVNNSMDFFSPRRGYLLPLFHVHSATTIVEHWELIQHHPRGSPARVQQAFSTLGGAEVYYCHQWDLHWVCVCLPSCDRQNSKLAPKISHPWSTYPRTMDTISFTPMIRSSGTDDFKKGDDVSEPDLIIWAFYKQTFSSTWSEIQSRRSMRCTIVGLKMEEGYGSLWDRTVAPSWQPPRQWAP